MLLTMRGLVALLMLAGTTFATAQSSRAINAQETMQIEEQPGREAGSDEELPAVFRRQMVFFRTMEAPGTVIIHTSDHFLYVVQGNNRAIRYGIGVGRDGFQWEGLLKITRKLEWPDWNSATGNDPAATLSAALDGRRSRQSAWRARSLSRHHGVSNSRH